MLHFFLSLKANLERFFPMQKYLQFACKKASTQVTQNRVTYKGYTRGDARVATQPCYWPQPTRGGLYVCSFLRLGKWTP